jgi:hypothetical protein
LLCRDELKPITLILAGRIHPEIFITDDSYYLIQHFLRFKRYGIQFLYPKGFQEIPNPIFTAFEIVSGALDKIESDKIKSAKEQTSQKK